VTRQEAVSTKGVRLELMPAVTAAVMTYVGSFETIGDAYRQLGAFVAGNARSARLPVGEYHMVNVDPETGLLLPSDQLRTDILWSISNDASSRSDEKGIEPAKPTRKGEPS
jgi:hypothetical protein